MSPRILNILCLVIVALLIGLDASARSHRGPGGCPPNHTWNPDALTCIYTPRRPPPEAAQIKNALVVIFGREITLYPDLRDRLGDESQLPFKTALALANQFGGGRAGAEGLRKHLSDARNKQAFEQQTGLSAFIAEREAMRQKKELDEKLAEQKKQAQQKQEADAEAGPRLAECEEYPHYPGCDKVLADAGKPIREPPKVKPWPGPGARPPLQICEDYPVYAGCDSVLAEAQEQQAKKQEAEKKKQAFMQGAITDVFALAGQVRRGYAFVLRAKTSKLVQGVVLTSGTGAERKSVDFKLVGDLPQFSEWEANVSPIVDPTAFSVLVKGPDYLNDERNTIVYSEIAKRVEIKPGGLTPAEEAAEQEKRLALRPTIGSIDPLNGKLLDTEVRVLGRNFDDIQHVRISGADNALDLLALQKVPISGGSNLPHRRISSNEIVVTIGEPAWGSRLDVALQITTRYGSAAQPIVSPSGPVTKNRLGNPEYCFPAVGNACYGAAEGSASETGLVESALKSIVTIGCSAEVNGQRNCWVVPGSIKHDNCCLIYPGGKRCGGPGTDGNKAGESNHNGQCVAEWSAATADVGWRRAWVARFNTREPADLTPVPSTRIPNGIEVMASAAHCAPDGHELREQADQAFCCSGRAENKVCRYGGRTVQQLANVHLGDPLAGPPPAPGESVSRPRVADVLRKQPSGQLHPDKVYPGQTVMFSGHDFAPNLSLVVFMPGQPLNPGETRTTVGADGRVSNLSFRVPAGTKPGTYSVVLGRVEELLMGGRPDTPFRRDELKLALTVLEPKKLLEPEPKKDVADQKFCNPDLPRLWQPGCVDKPVTDRPKTEVAEPVKPRTDVVQPVKPKSEQTVKVCDPNLPRLWQPGCVEPASGKPQQQIVEPSRPPQAQPEPRISGPTPEPTPAHGLRCDPGRPRYAQPGCIDAPVASSPPAGQTKPAVFETKPLTQPPPGRRIDDRLTVPAATAPTKPAATVPTAAPATSAPRCNPDIPRYSQPGCIP